MIHVLFVAGWWPSEDDPINGVFIQEHALAISKFAKITVLHLNKIEKSNNWNYFPAKFHFKKTTINRNLNVYVYNAQFNFRRYGILEWKISKFVNKFISQFDKTAPIDLIHLNIAHFFLPLHILENSSKFKKPIVLTEHSTFLHTEINNLQIDQNNQKRSKLISIFDNYYLKAVLPVSKQLGEVFIKDYKIPTDKITTIANVANDCFIDCEIEKQRTSSKTRIFAAANWQDSKDPLLFFQTLLKLKKDKNEIYLNLLINWGGEGKYMDSVKFFVKNELPDLKINFLGQLRKQEISYHMQLSHFLVHPTISENLPCIIIESLCMGLPVLTANVNGCSELLNETNGILYAAKDGDDLYSKLLDMIQRKETFNKDQISMTARKKYCASAIGNQIVNVYNNILLQKNTTII